MSSLLDPPRTHHLHHQVKPFLGTQRAMNNLTNHHYHLLDNHLHPHQLHHQLLLFLHLEYLVEDEEEHWFHQVRV